MFLAPVAAVAQGVTATYIVGAGADRDPATPGVQVREGDSITITLDLLFAPGADLNDEWGTNAVNFTGTATAGEDFTRDGSTVHDFPATQDSWGLNALTVTYTITDDSTPEPDETMILPVPAPIGGGGTTIARDEDLVITILASDQPEPPGAAYTIGLVGDYGDEHGLGGTSELFRPALSVTGSGTLTEDLRVVYWISETSQSQVSNFDMVIFWTHIPFATGATAEFGRATFTPAQVEAAAMAGTPLVIPQITRFGSINEGAGYRFNLVQSIPARTGVAAGTFGAGAADTITVAVNRANGPVYEMPSGTAVPFPDGVNGFGANGRADTTGTAIAASAHFRENRPVANSERLVGWTETTVRVREGEDAILPFAMGSTNPVSIGNISLSLTISVAGVSQPVSPQDLDVIGPGTARPDGVPDSAFPITAGLIAAITFNRRSGQFRIPTVDDNQEEPPERFLLEISSVAYGTVDTDSRVATVIIDDNDGAPPAIAGAGPATVEEGVTATYTLTLTLPLGTTLSDAVTINYAATATGAVGNTVEGADFGAGSGSVSFAAGSTRGATRDILVPITDDTLNEGTETFVVQLQSDSAAVPVSPADIAAAIAPDDDDAIVIRINPRTYSERTGGGGDPADAQGNLLEGSTVGITIGDFRCLGGEATEEVRLSYTTDRFGEVNEDGLYFTIANSHPEITITTNAVIMTPNFVNNAMLCQAAGTALIFPDDNYNEGSQTAVVRFDPSSGESAGPVTIRGSNVGDPPGEWRITRFDNDPTIITATAASARFPEGQTAVFNLEYGGGIRIEDVPLQWRVITGAAPTTISPDDFTSGNFPGGAALTEFPSGTLTIRPDDTAGVIRLQVNGDVADTALEPFALQLSVGDSVRGDYILAQSEVAAAIDGVQRQSVRMAAPPAAAEGSTATVVLTLGLIDSSPLGGALNINYRVEPASAAANPSEDADITASARSGTVTFAADAVNGTTASIMLPIVDDNLNEGTETFVVQLEDTVAADLQVRSVTGEIAPDEADTIVITVSSRLYPIRNRIEGDGLRTVPTTGFGCTGGRPTEPVRFTYTTERIGDVNEDGIYFHVFVEATVTTDSVILNPAFINDVASCASDRGQAMMYPDDNYNEGTQTVILRFAESVGESAGPVRIEVTTGSANTIAGEWTVSWRDDDPSTVRFIPDTPRTGFDESAPAVFNIALSGGTLVDTVPLQWSVSTEGIISGAVSAGDFTDDAGNPLTALPTGVALLERGTTEAVVSIELPLNSTDAADEFREAFTFSLSIPSTAPGIYNLIPPPVRGAIAGRHRQRITAAATGAAEGASASITLTLDLTSGDLTGAPASLPAEMAVTWLALPGPADSANPAEVADIAAAGRTGQITFASGAADGATAAISLPIVNDRLNEGTETWTVVLDGADGATDTPEAITADIPPDPADTIVVTFPAVDVSTFISGSQLLSIAEGAGFPTDTDDQRITFSGGAPTEDIRFAYTLQREGEALTGRNYINAFIRRIGGPRTSAFGAGDCPAGATQSGDTLCFSWTPYYVNGDGHVQDSSPVFDFRIPVPDDNFNEGTQTIDFRFRDALVESGGAVEVTGGPVRLLFADNDNSTITLRASTTATAEGGLVRITAEVGGGIPGADLPLDYAFETTLQAADFNDDSGSPLTTLDGTLTVPAMTTSAVLTLRLRDDNLYEPDETQFALTFTPDVANAATRYPFADGSTSQRIVIAVADNDNPRYSLTAATANAAEGDRVRFSARLANENGAAVTLQTPATLTYTAALGAGEANATGLPDFIDSGGGTLIIPAGESSAAFSVRILHDGFGEAAETLTVTLTGAEPSAVAAGAPLSASVQIAASEETGPRLMLEGPETIAEPPGGLVGAATTATYTVTLGGFTADTTVTWQVSGIGERGTTFADYSGAQTGTLNFAVAGGGAAQTFSFAVATDIRNEGDETLQIELTAPGVPALRRTATITDNDDDTVTVTLLEAITAPEGDIITARLEIGGGEHTAPVEVDYRVPPGAGEAAASAADFSGAIAGRATIAVATTAAEVRITTINDNLNEPSETFHIVFENAESAGRVVFGATTRTQVTLTDDDPTMLSVRQAPAGAVEEGGRAMFRIEASGGELTEAVRLRWSVTTATDVTLSALPADFGDGMATDFPGGNVTIGAGATASPVFTVALFDDGLNEMDEQYNVELDEVNDARYPREALSGAVIEDNDTIFLSLEPVPPGTQIDEETSGSHTFRVGAGGMQGTSVSVVVTVGGDAVLTGSSSEMDATILDAGMNSLGTSFMLGIETTRTFSVMASDDNLNEGAERITVQLSQPMAFGGAALGAVSRTEIAIAPSDPITASVVANQTTAQETEDATFTVALHGGAPTDEVIVRYDIAVEQNHTSNGASVTIEQSTGRPDFLDLSARGAGMLAFAAGAAGATGVITLNIHRDGYEESTETLTLTLTDVTAAGPAMPAAGAASTAATVIQASERAFRVVRARLGGIGLCPDAVDGFFGVPGSPATLGLCDFGDNVLTLPQLTEDGVAIYYEPAGNSGAGVQFARVTVAFENVAGAPYVENHQIALNLIADDAASAARLGAVPAGQDDRTGGRSGGVSSGDITFALSADRFNEGTETFVVQIGITDYDEDNDIFVDRGTVIEYETPVFGSFGIAAFRGMILDHPDDTLITSVADAAAPVDEGATASFTVTLGGATATADTTVPYTTSLDVTGSGVVTIAEGETTAELVVTAVDDDLNEGLDRFFVQLLPGASAGAVRPSETASRAFGLITTSDDIHIVSLAPAFDGDAMEGDIAEFVVTASNPSEGEFTLRWLASAGGPTQPLQPCSVADLCFVPGTRGRRFMPAGDILSAEAAFVAGATTTTFSLIVNQDNRAEPREMLTVWIDPDEARPGPGAGAIIPTLEGGATAQADLHIAANDAAMRFLTAGNLSWMRLREGDVASFDVALSGTTPTSPVMVQWVVDSDAGVDPNEADAVNMAEPSDYAPASGELRFTPENFTGPQTAFLTITDDDLNESTETLVVRLFGQMGGGDNGVAAQVTGTVVMNIRQSDPLTWAITERPPASVAEDAGDLRYDITLSGRSEGRIEFPVAVTGAVTVSADADDPLRDVTLPGGTTASAVFAIGSTRTGITLTLHDDAEFERPETLIVELPAAGAEGIVKGARAGPATRAPRENDHRAITTIRDNDNAVVTLAGPAAPVAEGGSAAFTATLSGVPLGLDVEIDYSVGIVAQASTGTTAQNTVANPDFAPGFTPGADTTGTLVIAAGTTQTVLTYQIVRDGLAENDETLQFQLHPQEGGNVVVNGSATISTVIQSIAAPVRLSAAPAPGYAAAVSEGDAIAWRIEVAPTGSTTPETLVLHYAVVDGDGNAAVTDIGADIASDIGFANGRVFGGATHTEVGHIPATQTFTLTTPELTVYRDGVREGVETLFLAVALGTTSTVPASQQDIETLTTTLPLTDGRVDATLTIAASDRPENGPPAPRLTTLPAAPDNTTAVVVMEGDVLSVGALLPGGGEIPRDWRIGFTLQSTGPGGADLQNDLDLSAVFSEGAGESFFPAQTTGTSVVTATLVGSVFADAPDNAPRYATAASLLIPVTAGDGIEEDESFLITLTNPSPSLRLGDTDTITRLVTIQSPEVAAELADLNVTITPPAGEVIEGDDAVFTITVANDGRTQPVNVAWQAVLGPSGAAPVGRADVFDIDLDAVIAASIGPLQLNATSVAYTIGGGMTAVAPDTSTATLVIPITDDDRAERAETFTVRFFSAVGGGAFRRTLVGGDFEVTIAANDVQLQIRRDAPPFAPDAVAEGETARFVVSLADGGEVEENILAAWEVLDADGAASADWNPAMGSVTLTPASPEQTIEITAVEDGLPEPREMFTVQLPDESTGTTVAIARSVGAANLVSVRAVAGAVTESAAAQAVFVVDIARRTLATTAMVTLATGGDAAAGDDYTAPATTLEFPAGVDRAEVAVALMDDADAEYDEAITLSIAGAMDSNGGALPFISEAATITVIDDDREAVSLALAGPFDADGELLEEIAEGSTVTVTLTATGLADSGAMRIAYAVGDATDAATIQVDYNVIVPGRGDFDIIPEVGITGEVPLTAAAPEDTFVVVVLADNFNEDAETISIRVDSPAANNADPLTVAIAADDVPLSLIVSAPGPQDGDFSMFPGGFSEGDTVRFEVRVSGGLERTVRLPWRIAGVSVAGPDGRTQPASADDFAASGDTAAGITMPGPTAGVVVLTPDNPIGGVMVPLRVDTEAEPPETFELRVDADGLAAAGGADIAAVATIFASDAVELPAPPVFAPGDGSVALTGPDDMLAGETGEWTAEWTGAPSDEPVTLTVVFNGIAGLTRRACFEDVTEGAHLGCTLIESEAAVETVGATLLRWQNRTAVTDFVSVRATATEVDVIFQQPLSSTQRSIVFNAPVRRGDRVSFRVRARNELRDSAPSFLDSDGNEIVSPPRSDPRFDQSIPNQDPAVVHRNYLNGVFMGSAPGPGDPVYQTLRPIRTDFPGDQTAACLTHRPGGFLPEDLPCAAIPVQARPGLETDESFTLHLEDGGGSRRSNAAATTIRRVSASLLVGPSHIRVGIPAGYSYDKFSNPDWQSITTFGNFWRVEAATLGGPVTRECQIATPADFGGAFPSAQTGARVGRDPGTESGSSTEGAFSFTVNAANITLADSGPCARKYIRVVLDPAQPLIDEFQGFRATPPGWSPQVVAYVDTDAPINRGGAHFNAPVSRLVSISREPVRGRTGGFLVARLGALDHPDPNQRFLPHNPKTGAGGEARSGSITGQYLGMLHSHYSGGQLVEGAARRFTVSYYGPALRSTVTVPWHIEGIADAAAQFEQASGFVTFPAGLEGGSIITAHENAYVAFTADNQCRRLGESRLIGSIPTFCTYTLNWPDSLHQSHLRTFRDARVRFVEGPIAVQRGIDITPRNDAVAEGAQSFRVVLGEPVAAGGPALAGAGESADGVIAASDSFRRVALDGPAQALTPGAASTFSVVWSGALPATDTSVQWRISGDAAGLFSPANGMVTFAQGDAATQSFTLTPMASETTSTFGVSLTPAAPPADMPPHIWRNVPETVPTGAGQTPVNLPTGIADAIEGDAGTPGEFTVAQSPAPPEPTSSGINFQLACPDSVVEGEEAFCTLTHVGPDPIADQITITWRTSGTGVNRGDCGDFMAALCSGRDGGMIASGSADGATATLAFRPLADSEIELDEAFTVTVEPLDSGGDAAPNVVILDNDQVVRIRGQIAGASLAARSADAGEGGGIAFAISLARATTAEVSVAWEVRAVSEGGRAAVELADLGDGGGGSLAGAQDGDEFTFGDVRGFVSTGTATTILTGTAVFAEADSIGTGTLIVTLPAIDDAVNEPAETLEVALPEVSSAAVAGYVIVGADGVTTRTVATTITLHDNDTARISIERADADGFVEGPAGVSTGTRTARFRVRADGGPGFQLATTAMVSVLVSGAAPGDFEASADTLMLAPGTAGVPSATLVITAVDNDRNEPPRTMLASLGAVQIAGAFEYTERVEAAAVLMDDDDITATLTPPEQTVAENGAATLTLELDRAAEVDVSVPYTVAPAPTAGATAADFAEDAALEGMFELAAGATMASVALAVIVDAEAETTETAVATLGAAVLPAGSGAIETIGTATVRIAQNDAARVLTAQIIGGVVTETDASAQGSFLVDAGDDTAFTANTEVRWRIEHITTSDADFDAVTGAVTMTANISTQTATFNVAGDNLNEGRETFRIHLSVDDAAADGRTAIGAPAAGAVVDDDRLGITFRATTGTESVSMAPTTTVAESSTMTPLATILATLADAEPTGVVTASFVVGGDGVDARDFDITTPTGLSAAATTGTLVFAQGRTTAVIVLSISDDNLSEGDETVRVERGAGAFAAGGFRAATASDAAQFTILASDSTLFAAGVAEPRVAEGDAARLVVELGGGALAATATLTWRATIADQTNTSVRDPRRLNTLQQPDLAADSGVIMLPANSTRVEAAIATARDGREEDDEEVLVTLASESGTLMPDPARDDATEARFVIAGNDAATNFLTWSLDTRRAAEGTTATLTMVLSGRAVGASVVSAAIHLNDAADVEGGAPAALRLTGFNTQTVSLVMRDDDLNEGDETLEVSVRASRDGDVFEVLESETTRTITIPMSDYPTTITAAASRLTPEGADAVFPLTFEGGRPGEAVTVAWSVTSTNVLTNAALPNAASPADFGDGTATSLPMASAVIEAGARRGEIRVPTFADSDQAEEVEQFVLLLDSSEPGPPRYTLGPAVIGEVTGADLVPPSLEALPWVPGQRAIWLVSDEDLFVAVTHSAAASSPRGTALRGFSVGRGAGQAAAQAAASAVSAVYEPLRGIALTLNAPLAEDGGMVFVFYDYPGGGAVGVFDEVAAGLTRNQMTTQTVVVARSINGGEDFDGDGLPDAAEINAGENPLIAGGAAGLPVVTIGRASPAHFAYSGVRADGAAAHLGVSATPQGTALSAWYLSDTFGFEGTYPEFEMATRRYGCLQEFPARYSLPPAQGGCQIVDWENVRAGVEHRIGWLALNAGGLWAVNTATASNLPEMTVRRVPEVRMDAARLYANDTQTATVAASHDGAADDSLVIEFRHSTGAAANVARVAASAGQARFVTMTSVSATWEIAGMTTSAAAANTDLLWRAGDGVGGLSAASYSLGAVTRTRVDNVGAAPVAPVFGRATLVRGGDAVAALVAGVSGYRLDVRVGSLGAGATVTARDTASVLTGANAPSVSVADHVASVSFDVPTDAATTGTVAILLEARNPGGGAATATWVYPVVATANPLALANDADNDGIADFYDFFDAVTTDDEPRRSYGGAALLPVSVADTGATAGAAARVAGMTRGHHIRAVSPQHELHIGAATRERLQARAAEVAAAVAANEEDELRYNDFAASRFSDNAAGQPEVVYDFEVRGVEPEPAEEGGITGGRAGVIIPLSRNFLDAVPGAVLRPVKEGVGADGAGGGAGDATAPDGTRAFSRDPADGDYGFASYIGDINDEDGRCPDAGSGAYTLGPGRGDCLLLWIVDGGANDDDGVRNGVIQDPVRLIRTGATGGTRSHSGTFDPAGLLALLALAALTLRRRRRT